MVHFYRNVTATLINSSNPKPKPSHDESAKNSGHYLDVSPQIITSRSTSRSVVAAEAHFATQRASIEFERPPDGGLFTLHYVRLGETERSAASLAALAIAEEAEA